MYYIAPSHAISTTFELVIESASAASSPFTENLGIFDVNGAFRLRASDPQASTRAGKVRSNKGNFSCFSR